MNDAASLPLPTGPTPVRSALARSVSPADRQRVLLLQMLPAALRSRVALSWERAPDDELPLRYAITECAGRCRDAGMAAEQMTYLLTSLMPEPERELADEVDRLQLRRRLLSLALERYHGHD